MNLPRVIPCLLLQNKGLVKTVRFKSPTYIGDPTNAVKIYNEMEADELIFLDIDSSVNNKQIEFDIIAEIANEAFMPVCYGGGVKNLATFKQLLKIGIEKVSINTAAFENIGLVEEVAGQFGRQSVVVSIDVRLIDNKYMTFTHGGSKPTNLQAVDAAVEMEKRGAGEIFLNYIDYDGLMTGYNIDLIQRVTNAVGIPVVACGGAGTLNDFKMAIKDGGANAVAAGSRFVYWGRLNGILINYPKREQLMKAFL